jgi:hypothetical protein
MHANRPKAFTLDEVIMLDFEAYCREADGLLWLWRSGVCLLWAPATGRCTPVCGRGLLPQGPWHPTFWGERELRAMRPR